MVVSGSGANDGNVGDDRAGWGLVGMGPSPGVGDGGDDRSEPRNVVVGVGPMESVDPLVGVLGGGGGPTGRCLREALLGRGDIGAI